MSFKVGGGLCYVTGPMGSGKSFYGVRKISDALYNGQYVVTNVELKEDAFRRMARHSSYFARGEKRDAIAEYLAGFYVFEQELATAIKYRPPGKGESRALFVWDEGHNDLNNRDWRDEGRRDILKWATQLRKLGFVGYLLSQHADNTDAALRRVCNWVIKMQNQREHHRAWRGMRMMGLPVLILAYFYPPNLAESRTKIPPTHMERYVLDWRRKLYDSWAVFHGLDADGDSDSVILLPEGGRRRVIAPAIAPPDLEIDLPTAIPEPVLMPANESPGGQPGLSNSSDPIAAGRGLLSG